MFRSQLTSPSISTNQPSSVFTFPIQQPLSTTPSSIPSQTSTPHTAQPSPVTQSPRDFYNQSPSSGRNSIVSPSLKQQQQILPQSQRGSFSGGNIINRPLSINNPSVSQMQNKSPLSSSPSQTTSATVHPPESNMPAFLAQQQRIKQQQTPPASVGSPLSTGFHSGGAQLGFMIPLSSSSQSQATLQQSGGQAFLNSPQSMTSPHPSLSSPHHNLPNASPHLNPQSVSPHMSLQSSSPHPSSLPSVSPHQSLQSTSPQLQTMSTPHQIQQHKLHLHHQQQQQQQLLQQQQINMQPLIQQNQVNQSQMQQQQKQHNQQVASQKQNHINQQPQRHYQMMNSTNSPSIVGFGSPGQSLNSPQNPTLQHCNSPQQQQQQQNIFTQPIQPAQSSAASIAHTSSPQHNPQHNPPGLKKPGTPSANLLTNVIAVPSPVESAQQTCNLVPALLDNIQLDSSSSLDIEAQVDYTSISIYSTY